MDKIWPRQACHSQGHTTLVCMFECFKSTYCNLQAPQPSRCCGTRRSFRAALCPPGSQTSPVSKHQARRDSVTSSREHLAMSESPSATETED